MVWKQDGSRQGSGVRGEDGKTETRDERGSEYEGGRGGKEEGREGSQGRETHRPLM